MPDQAPDAGTPDIAPPTESAAPASSAPTSEPTGEAPVDPTKLGSSEPGFEAPEPFTADSHPQTYIDRAHQLLDTIANKLGVTEQWMVREVVANLNHIGATRST